MSAKRVYEIDGSTFWTLPQFYEEISRVLIPDAEWGHNLDAFNDVLRGGFGTPEEGFVLRWKDSKLSRDRLGFPETVRQLKIQQSQSHPSHLTRLAKELRNARDGVGPTVFDWLVEIIQDHCAGGKQAADGVELELL